MLAGPFIPARFARGTVIAEMGLLLVGAYYLMVWRSLKQSPPPAVIADPPFPPAPLPWPELRFLQWGIFVSVVFFMLAAAVDGAGDWPALLCSLMGFCAALFFSMFAVGFVCLFYLWKELVLQLRKAGMRPLFLSFPLAIFWLLLGLAVMFFLGEILAPMIPALTREVLWSLLALAFYGLWTGRAHAALMLRAILMVLFSLIMVVAAAFAYGWIVRQTTFPLVLFLSAMGTVNVLFYARWVRVRALKDQWIDVS